MKTLKIESYKRGIAISTVLNIFAKGIQFINTLLIAYYFGVNSTTDIYFCVLSVSTLICSAINGIDYHVLVPEAIKQRERDGETKSREFFNFFIYLYLIIGVIFSFFLLVYPIFFFNTFSKFKPDFLQQNTFLLYFGSIIITFQLLNNLLNAILTSYRYFTISILTNLLNNLFAIVFTVVLHEYIGISGTLLGISLGYIINFILLIAALKFFQKWQFSHVSFLKDKVVWKNIALMQINILPVWLRSYIVLYIISGMNKGAITSMNLALTIAAIPEIFILTQVMSVVGIKFSELAAQGDLKRTSYILSNLTTLLLLIIIPIAIMMAVCNKDIIAIVFERGSFDRNATNITALCFFYFSLILPTKIFDIVFTKLFTAYQVYGLSTLFAVIGHSVITLIIYFAITYFQLTGYFIALIIGNTLILPITYYVIIKLRFNGIDTSLLTKNFILFSVFMSIVLFCASIIRQYLYFVPLINIIIITIFSFVSIFLLSYFTIDIVVILEYWSKLRNKLKKNFNV